METPPDIPRDSLGQHLVSTKTSIFVSPLTKTCNRVQQENDTILAVFNSSSQKPTNKDPTHPRVWRVVPKPQPFTTRPNYPPPRLTTSISVTPGPGGRILVSPPLTSSKPRGPGSWAREGRPRPRRSRAPLGPATGPRARSASAASGLPRGEPRGAVSWKAKSCATGRENQKRVEGEGGGRAVAKMTVGVLTRVVIATCVPTICTLGLLVGLLGSLVL